MNTSQQPADASLEYAWKWFELHVAHRTSALNFLLLAFSALAVAYAGLITVRQQAAGVVALTGAAIALCFLRLDSVTMHKILEAKRILEKMPGPGGRLFADSKPLFGDRTMTRIFEGMLASVSAAGALHAFGWL